MGWWCKIVLGENGGMWENGSINSENGNINNGNSGINSENGNINSENGGVWVARTGLTSCFIFPLIVTIN